MGNEKFYLDEIKYLVSFDDEGYKRINNLDCYGKIFTIYKNGERWSVVGLSITGRVIAGWKIMDKYFDINRFLSQIAPYSIKVGIYHKEINKIGDDQKITDFTFGFLEPTNFNQKKALKTPAETIEYYKNQAQEISKSRIGF